ncbi:hypothetical protein JCM10914A_21850 [Paenibacillus sp. JCM 10914]|uniref:hypothetical protein n=1 Tax=Paenibacillus sp. JCM 10914 TaxID=1236974 RepID=UPI0003CC482A|nr:hypothetical protein [Paenibacillus sp. JCM 10914]GAE09338.1 hypothetical protein JCM10914_5696 [Paenibacillus sp. JCM 10914]
MNNWFDMEYLIGQQQARVEEEANEAWKFTGTWDGLWKSIWSKETWKFQSINKRSVRSNVL